MVRTAFARRSRVATHGALAPTVSRFVGSFLGLAIGLLFCPHAGGERRSGLSAGAVPTTVITGATVPFAATVTNTGSGTLNYTMTYTTTSINYDGTTNSSVAFGPQSGSPLGSGTQQTWNSNVSTAALCRQLSGPRLDGQCAGRDELATNRRPERHGRCAFGARDLELLFAKLGGGAEPGRSPIASPDPLAFGATGGGRRFRRRSRTSLAIHLPCRQPAWSQMGQVPEGRRRPPGPRH